MTIIEINNTRFPDFFQKKIISIKKKKKNKKTFKELFNYEKEKKFSVLG